MTFNDLRNKALNEYYPGLFFEVIVPVKLRTKLHSLAWYVFIFFTLILLVMASLAQTHAAPAVELYLAKAYGAFFIALSFLLIAVALQSFYNSFYDKDILDDPTKTPVVPFGLGRSLYYSHGDDVIAEFIQSEFGLSIMMRLGISPESIADFLAQHHKLPGDSLVFEDGKPVSYEDFMGIIFDADQEFAKFLFGHGIQKAELLATVTWIGERMMAEKRKVRWWSRDKLGRVPGLGKNWAYGRLIYLEDYCRPIPYVSAEYEAHSVYGTKELQELEAVLVKSRGANAFLIGNDREGQINIIARLNRMIDDGTALPELEHKRIALFDNELMTSTAHTKAEFETKMLQLMHEASYADNIILVFVDFPALIASARALGSDITALIDQYLTASNLHLVGLTSVDQFHKDIEPNSALMQRFERILMEGIDENNAIKVLENEIIPIEYQFDTVFTYPSLVSIAEGAVRYFPDALMPDRAVELMLEIAPLLAEKGKHIIHKEDVLELISRKTGMPVGDIGGEEREKLLNLESILHARIIGQDEAVAAISGAVRRARSGINNPNRPLASFLFLGPTGVGKTETTKALAEVFFGAEARIERLDMSEYSSANALEKLTGSFENGKPGVLSSMLREHPYGVLLLDEFEKTTPEVMNLFLQVLDEGVFSDMSGKKINAHNLLIIATSNAGADVIWQGLKVGDDFSQAKDYIIDRIIEAGTFKPELINRFDGVIVFHPLGKQELQKVAALQLDRLKKRLAERGINLVVNEDLINYVVSFGVDPKFGARPMNRAIQDKVEQAVAEKMIRDNLKTGAEISLSLTELKK